MDLPDREELRRVLDSGAVSDALDCHGVWSVVPPNIRHVGGGARKFFGRAHTIAWGPVRKGRDIRAPMPSTWDQVRDFLAPTIRDGTGTVYVGGPAGGGTIDRFALAGGLSSRHFDSIGMEAMVLGGAMRDADDLSSRKLPIWATGMSPADTQGNYAVVASGTACFLGDVRVQTGDWLFGDGAGIVVVPAALYESVMRRALEIVAVEGEMERRLDAGENLLDILERSGHI